MKQVLVLTWILLLGCNNSQNSNIQNRSPNQAFTSNKVTASSYMYFLGSPLRFFQDNCHGTLTIDTINDEYDSWLQATCLTADSGWIRADLYNLDSPIINSFESNDVRYFAKQKFASFFGASLGEQLHQLQPMYDEGLLYFKAEDTILLFSDCFSDSETSREGMDLVGSDSTKFLQKFGDCRITSIRIERLNRY
jgi:hypothetical protein